MASEQLEELVEAGSLAEQASEQEVVEAVAVECLAKRLVQVALEEQRVAIPERGAKLPVQGHVQQASL